jgi:hypothetical protein
MDLLIALGTLFNFRKSTIRAPTQLAKIQRPANTQHAQPKPPDYHFESFTSPIRKHFFLFFWTGLTKALCTLFSFQKSPTRVYTHLAGQHSTIPAPRSSLWKLYYNYASFYFWKLLITTPSIFSILNTSRTPPPRLRGSSFSKSIYCHRFFSWNGIMYGKLKGLNIVIL